MVFWLVSHKQFGLHVIKPDHRNTYTKRTKERGGKKDQADK